MNDVIVAGGGIMGMLTARELLKQGMKVTLVEKSETGKEASWAGGGIVSPLYPWNYVPAISRLVTLAQDFYPALVAQLLDETGIDAELWRCGLLMLDPPDYDKALAWGPQFDKAVIPLDSAQVAQQEPNANPDWQRALWLPHVSNVRNPRMLKALRASLLAQPAFTLVEHQQVVAIKPQASGVLVESDAESFVAGQVVVCAGAWSRELLSPLGLDVPVVPVRGQMLLFESRPGWINSIILKDGKYVIPRRDGHILVGSTTEETGFDKTCSNEARELLLQHAVDIIPALREVPVVAQWAGLRPGSPGGVPFVGAVPGAENVFVNTGHYRNGLVLAPASARLMADIVAGHEPLLDPAPYDPARPQDSLALI